MMTSTATIDRQYRFSPIPIRLGSHTVYRPSRLDAVSGTIRPLCIVAEVPYLTRDNDGGWRLNVDRAARCGNNTHLIELWCCEFEHASQLPWWRDRLQFSHDAFAFEVILSHLAYGHVLSEQVTAALAAYIVCVCNCCPYDPIWGALIDAQMAAERGEGWA